MEPKHFEDLAIGDSITSLRRTITETDIVMFMSLTNFFEVLFMDAEYALEKSIFKKRVAPGPLTFSVAEGLLILTGWNQGTGMGLLGVDEMRLMAPVAAGDTIYAVMEVIDKRETSRPDRGLMVTKHTVKNQKGETVMEYKITRFLRRRQGS